MKKQFAVIGLGRFGMSITEELSRMGYEVLAMDSDEDKVNVAVDLATHAVRADAMDEQVLKSLGLRNFDVVIVAIGQNIQANILTSIMLKEMGVKTVGAKAQNYLHGKVLEKVGVDIVVYPERDMGVKMARSLVSQNIMELIDLSPDYSIIELVAPASFSGRSILDLDVRKQVGVNILAIKRAGGIIMSPGAEQVINDRDVLVVVGRNDQLRLLSRLP